MILNVKDTFVTHVKNNMNRYFLLLIAFIIGVSAGAFTVNGLSTIQRDELNNYFRGFLQLLDNHKMNSTELMKIALMENAKIIMALWVLGVMIIGIPFVFVIVGIRGFMTGFSSAFIIKTLGVKGMLFSFFALLPKEIIIVPCIIALGVNGINFSLNIIKKKPMKNISKESIKTNFAAYCFVTLFFSSIVFLGVLVDVYVIPVFMRMIAPIIVK